MSHLILKKVDGKWRMYDKHKKESVGPSFSSYAAGEKAREVRDEKEDKEIDKSAKKEVKEHPEFGKSGAKKIAIDHFKEGKE